MPGSVEIVSAPAVVRDLEGDERFVLDQFEQHTAHCTQCTHALDASHDTLCERGHAYAIDLSKYLYSQGGKHFAVVDRENGKLRRVKLPREAKSALHLLEGIEAGLLLRASRRGRTRAVRPPSRDLTVPVPTGSYDSTYDVRPRLPVREHVERRPRSFSPMKNPPRQPSSPASLAAPVGAPVAAPPVRSRTTASFFTSLLAARPAVVRRVEARCMALTSWTVPNAATNLPTSSADLTTTVD
ncbi:hypothetical protein N7509_010154 [Penicillium cosmopolitanum]|uniref:Uncharacterized protein n=1 Tax=Penicillium cosmopolitanum TaxID=1131564 RepID=A0A9W9VQU0_9EURO|nr:uncharacterized protein N7509_010154 [Penicillium cosmopolitanum]KAJ5387613.1 hypothetical protein N7509_010154 [Penicillium cosmopolitanum]